MKRLFFSAILLALGTGATFAQSTTQDTTKKTTTTIPEVATTPSTSTTTTTTTPTTTTSTEMSTSTNVNTDDKKQPETNDPKATHEKKKKKKRKLNNPNIRYLVFLQNKKDGSKPSFLLLHILLLFLYNTLCKHSFCYFHKSGNVSSFYIVYITIFIFTIVSTSFVDTNHDFFQTSIYFFRRPVKT